MTTNGNVLSQAKSNPWSPMSGQFMLVVVLLLVPFSEADPVVTNKATVIIKEDQYTLTNQLFDSGKVAMTYDPDLVDQVGAAFVVDYTDPGGSGMDAYVSGTVGGKKSGGKWRPGNKALTGMPVQIRDLGYDTVIIRWSVSQENAWDDDDKWWATINVIFDSGTDISEPQSEDRLFDIVIELDRYEQDKLTDVSKDDKNSYWWFARNNDGSLRPFTLNIEGQDYEWGVRYKFFQNQGWKNNKVHVKFIPVDNDNVAPFINHPLRVFIDAATNFLDHVDLPTDERELANAKVSNPDLWVKAISAGYETYTGSSILRQDELRTVSLSPQPPGPTPTRAPTSSSPSPACFSGENHVHVMGKGTIPLRELKLGDHVKTANNDYSLVYSFGHLDTEAHTEFMEIRFSSDTLTSTLEVSSEHILFLNNKGMVAAREIRVGDVLAGDTDGGAVVHGVQRIYRQGLYSPTTAGGELVVSGIRVSCFAAILPQIPSQLQHQFVHAYYTPLRLWCQSVGCWSESYSTDGYATYLWPLAHIAIPFASKPSNSASISLFAVSSYSSLASLYSQL